MNKKNIMILVAVLLVVLIAIVATRKDNDMDDDIKEIKKEATEEKVSEEKTSVSTVQTEQNVKEFTMTSFVDVIEGKYYPQYSLKEMVVKKGDKVRIKITVTKGNHDFKIDEYNVYADTQLDKEEVIEFTADKAGEFIYYCTKPGHRELGHWGTLKVLE